MRRVLMRWWAPGRSAAYGARTGSTSLPAVSGLNGPTTTLVYYNRVSPAGRRRTYGPPVGRACGRTAAYAFAALGRPRDGAGEGQVRQGVGRGTS